MQLYSLEFIVFLTVLLAAYYALGRFAKCGQWVLLLVGSLGFYFATGWQNLLFILVTSVSTWAVGLAFAKLDDRCKEERAALEDRKERKAAKARFQHRKWLVLLAAMLVNFGVLGYIKYWDVVLSWFGAGDTFLASRLLLPLGISFYTFQSIGYAIDVYNGKFEPQRNYAKFLLFVSFFPQLIQGPINRYDAMAAQLYELHRFDLRRSRRALVLIGFGVMKKYLIADVLVSTISMCLDQIDPSTPGSVIAFGILLYTVQQYGDFSGGIDMVRGVAELFGIEMAENFRQPYFSTSLANFWQRWHITLGAWMRDYVFYPLAVRPSLLRLNKWGSAHLGKHVGRTLSACVGNVVVFLLVGLWHGAEAHYVLWGLYNGLVIALSDMLRPAYSWLSGKTHVNLESRGYRAFAILRTFLLVNIGRYFDRLTDAGDLAQGFYNTLFSFRVGDFFAWIHLNRVAYLEASLALAAIGCIILFAVSFQKERGVDVIGGFLRLNVALRVLAYIVVGACIMAAFSVAGTGGGFLYANF